MNYNKRRDFVKFRNENIVKICDREFTPCRLVYLYEYNFLSTISIAQAFKAFLRLFIDIRKIIIQLATCE